MKRRRVILVLAGVLAAGVVCVLVWPGEREPRYQGKKLSEWLLECGDGNVLEAETALLNANPEALEAVRHIGTNALPALLEWISYDTPKWERKVDGSLERLPMKFRRKIFRDRWQRHGGLVLPALRGFRVLGTVATPVLPSLVEMMQGRRRQSVSVWATYALGSLGKDALPVLLAEANNPASSIRINSVHSLAAVHYLGSNASPAIPVLLSCAADTNPAIRLTAIHTLGRLHIEPERVLPAVLAALRDSELGVRRQATNTLQSIAPELLQTNTVSGR